MGLWTGREAKEGVGKLGQQNGREECGRGRENLSFVSLFTTGHEVGLVSL